MSQDKMKDAEIVYKDLNAQLSWAHNLESSHLSKPRRTEYNRILSAILNRSKMLKSEFLTLAWMSAHVDQEYDTEYVSIELGISEDELSKCLVALENKALVVEDNSGLIDIVPSRIDSYYDCPSSGTGNLGSPDDKRRSYTESDVFAHLKTMTKEYVLDEQFTFNPSFLESFVMDHPDLQFSKGYLKLFPQLNYDERVAVSFLAGWIIWKGFVPYEYSDDSDHYDSFDSLIQKGLAVLCPQETGKDLERADNRILLSAKSCRDLFHGHRELLRYSSLSRQAELIRYEDVKEKELFYSHQDQDIVDTLQRIVVEKEYSEIVSRLEKKGRNRGISVVLYGGPGVGKTELVKQLARQSHRDIFNVDVSKIYGSLWGETEKNVRAVFRNFKYMASISPLAPILLFNEADGIMKERGLGDGQVIARSEDIIQTIILQELEDFEGFFFATTNIIEGIDNAFARRFLFKLEVHSPGVEARRKIWSSMIPDLDTDQADYLAEHYSFTGGQIDIILRRREIFEALNRRTPNLAEMITFCEEEISRKENSRKIGFVTYKKEINSR